jgi:type I restriction enzyme M protein
VTLVPFREGLERSAIAETVRSDGSVQQAHTSIIDSVNGWWGSQGRELIEGLRSEGALLHLTADQMKVAFVATLDGNGILNPFQVRGAFVEWLNLNEATLRTIIETGYPAALIDDDDVIAVGNPELLDQRDELVVQTEEINTQYDILTRINKVASNSNEEEGETEGEDEASIEGIGAFIPKTVLEPLEAEKKENRDKIKILLGECKEAHLQLFDREEVSGLAKKVRPTKGKTKPVMDDFHRLDDLVSAIDGIESLFELRGKLVANISEWETLNQRNIEIAEAIKPHEDYKNLRKELNDSLKTLKEQLFVLANEVRKTLGVEHVRPHVLASLLTSLESLVQKRLDVHVDDLIRLIQSMYGRYARTLSEIRLERDERAVTVDELLVRLGYLEDA